MTYRPQDTLCIISSDEDQPEVEDLTVGLDANRNLIVAIEHTDFRTGKEYRPAVAIVSCDEASRLARSLNISLFKLPEHICRDMSDCAGYINPSFSVVRDCFKELTERLLDEGCHLRIENNI